jgi:hypothetical protein
VLLAIADSKPTPTWVLATFGWLFIARIKMPEQHLNQNNIQKYKNKSYRVRGREIEFD